jgi:hypothetical protein
MRIDIVARPDMPHQVEFANALREGLNRHGVMADIVAWPRHAAAERVACWGWAIGAQLYEAGKDVLVGERGYIGDRTHWTSLGWNGLNGRAVRPPAGDKSRFWDNFGALMRPESTEGSYALLVGQVAGDASLGALDVQRWYAETAKAAQHTFHMPVKFRPHPEAQARGEALQVAGAKTIKGSLEDALSDAAVVITYNSNAGVDAVLAGKTVYAFDEGSMAWDVAAHSLDGAPVAYRDEWAAKVAWSQFANSELRSGLAWEHIRQAMP